MRCCVLCVVCIYSPPPPRPASPAITDPDSDSIYSPAVAAAAAAATDADVDAGAAREIVVPLVHDTKFYALLSTTLESIAERLSVIHADFVRSLTTRPPTARPLSERQKTALTKIYMRLKEGGAK